MNINPKIPLSKPILNSGFSPNSDAEGGRLVNKDGSTNIKKTGTPFWKRISLYHTLLNMPAVVFFATVFGIYAAINLFFATLYFLLGPDSLDGAAQVSGNLDLYLQAFFFSAQTLTTVGYGHISPTGLTANIVASIESFIGILSFAIVTGMFYARFSRPKAHLIFSNQFIVAPYGSGRGIMLRMATSKYNVLTNAEVELTTAIRVMKNGMTVTEFYPLELELKRINSLAVSWTVVHPIIGSSPFVNFTERDFTETKFEMMVTVRAYDEHFANTVQQRTSYTADEMVYGAKFVPMYERSQDGQYTEVMLDKLNSYKIADFD